LPNRDGQNNRLFTTTAQDKPVWFWILIIGIVVISCLLYVPQQTFYFSLNDDIVILYRAMLNTWRIQMSPVHVLDVFRFAYFPMLGTKLEKYRPIHNLLALILFPIFIGHPFGYHIITLLLHIAVVLALWRFARHLGLSPPVAVVSALLFLLYFPGAEVAIRFNVFPESLSTLFLLLAAIFFIRALESGNRFKYLLTILFCAMASMTKVSAIAFLVMLFLLSLHAQRNNKKLSRYSALWNWGTILISSVIFAIIFIINIQVQTGQWRLVQNTFQESWLDLLYIWIARPFMNLFPLGYPLPRQPGGVFFYDARFYISMAGGIAILGIAYWRVLRGDWLEHSMWILGYATLFHTLFLNPEARYQYMWGIPACVLLARYGLLIWKKTRPIIIRIGLLVLLTAAFCLPQIIDFTAITAESVELADYSHKTQQWAFNALQVGIRYPFERGLLVKREFIPTDYFLSKTYLYTPYREEVERYYGVKLPKLEKLGLSMYLPTYPMNEPTDWMKGNKKH
jgi:hypothetical protein